MSFEKGDVISVFGCGARGNHGCTAMLEIKVLEISPHTYPEGLPGGAVITGKVLDCTPCPTCGEFEDIVVGTVDRFCGAYRPDYYEHYGLQL